MKKIFQRIKENYKKNKEKANEPLQLKQKHIDSFLTAVWLVSWALLLVLFIVGAYVAELIQLL